MTYIPLRPCKHPGCNKLVSYGRCKEHSKQNQIEQDKRRGSANDRGYTYRWSLYSKAFLSNPENIFCKLQLPGCTNIAKCVDHIEPAQPNSPMFWNPSNHQPACIHCNSVKGRTKIVGNAEPFKANRKRN